MQTIKSATNNPNTNEKNKYLVLENKLIAEIAEPKNKTMKEPAFNASNALLLVLFLSSPIATSSKLTAIIT